MSEVNTPVTLDSHAILALTRINAQISVTDRATVEQINTLRDLGVDITPWLVAKPELGEVDAVTFTTLLFVWAEKTLTEVTDE